MPSAIQSESKSAKFPKPRFRDSDIRDVIRRTLVPPLAALGPSRLMEELQICVGEARIDVALVNCAMHGFEIKSDCDSLERLPRQVEFYGKVFDTMTIVCGTTHSAKIARAVPHWWAIYVVTASGGIAGLRQIQSGQRNQSVDPLAIAQLLWKEEAVRLLSSTESVSRLRRQSCRQLWELAATKISLPELQLAAREFLRARPLNQVAG